MQITRTRGQALHLFFLPLPLHLGCQRDVCVCACLSGRICSVPTQVPQLHIFIDIISDLSEQNCMNIPKGVNGSLRQPSKMHAPKSGADATSYGRTLQFSFFNPTVMVWELWSKKGIMFLISGGRYLSQEGLYLFPLPSSNIIDCFLSHHFSFSSGARNCGLIVFANQNINCSFSIYTKWKTVFNEIIEVLNLGMKEKHNAHSCAHNPQFIEQQLSSINQGREKASCCRTLCLNINH